MVWIVWFVFVFFFKQKTAYEVRISDWSSDVCSSDLIGPARVGIAADRARGRILPLIGQQGLFEGIAHSVGVGEGGRGGQRLVFGRRHVADQEVADRLVVDADHDVRGRRGNRLGHPAAIDLGAEQDRKGVV